MSRFSNPGAASDNSVDVTQTCSSSRSLSSFPPPSGGVLFYPTVYYTAFLSCPLLRGMFFFYLQLVYNSRCESVSVSEVSVERFYHFLTRSLTTALHPFLRVSLVPQEPAYIVVTPQAYRT
ncbi:hypothetical protein L873DRAFT_1348391 [Choiromyces venosus 120613-1]|uniref:Uncharacterized protein n=1 Tax=Choiromyces venosus 120613-1 TaxID=1336337 RepID=A0A3N4K1A7_9PEZI|nr:hypothetical protein L873DRAFT_1348391 [Choiromyces venosus 120613-1]